MPFKSAKQERFMFAQHPDIAKRWFAEHGNAKGYTGPKISKNAIKRRLAKNG